MTTTYYTLLTRKVKVSGGADLLKVVPVARPEGPAVSADGKILAPVAFGGTLPQTGTEGTGKAEILDFSLCRKHMETKNAWNALRQAAREEQEEAFRETRWVPAEPGAETGETPAELPAPTAKERAMTLLELCASAAVLLTALSAAIAFLALV